MADIRTRLAETLCNLDHGFWDDEPSQAHYLHVADVLLSLPGIAIVDTEETLRKLRYNSHDLGEFGKFIRLEYAAAILAAANAAEAVEVPYVHDEEMVENKI